MEKEKDRNNLDRLVRQWFDSYDDGAFKIEKEIRRLSEQYREKHGQFYFYSLARYDER